MTQIFFVDDASASHAVASTSHAPDADSDASSDEDAAAELLSALKSTNRRKAAWYDPADEELTVSLQGATRLRKLRTSAAEDVVGGLEYEGRLRRQ